MNEEWSRSTVREGGVEEHLRRESKSGEKKVCVSGMYAMYVIRKAGVSDLRNRV
jgi:hypothetical protein